MIIPILIMLLKTYVQHLAFGHLETKLPILRLLTYIKFQDPAVTADSPHQIELNDEFLHHQQN